MKKIIFCCFALLIYAYTNGQNIDPRKYSHDPKARASFFNEQIEKVKNNSEFIFEGIIQ